ncbi:hypothetical protein [Streptosporangium sp. NPDC051022]|uniref:hypothetical protein n=1 Tax=Streptosporangium sp. NPDC051022 TaxID=3155752 RepID=UPI0034250BC3
MMWRRHRTAGRHRNKETGPPVPAAPHRPWDGPARAEAERLTRTWTGWTVLYGPGSRRFYAVATWPTPEPLVLEDRTSEGLELRIRETEVAMTARRGVVGTAPYGLRAP